MKEMHKYIGGPVVLVLCLCVAGMISGCRKDPVNAENLGWDVAVHESVDVYDTQLDSVDGLKETEVQRLNRTYNTDQKAAVDSLLGRNSAYFDREDLSWEWMEDEEYLSYPGEVTLAIYRRTPAIRQTVDKAEIFPMQPADEEYVMAGFTFDDARLWEQVTEANIGEQLMFKVNGKLIYAPYVQSTITEGAASLILNPKNAKQLLPADVLTSFKKN